MARKPDLEQLIHRSVYLIAAYEKKKQASQDPTEILRCEDEIERQRTLIAGHCREYVKLCQAFGEPIPPEIALPCVSAGVDVPVPQTYPPYPPVPRTPPEEPHMFKLPLQFSQFGSQVQIRIDGGALAGQARADITLPRPLQLDTFAPAADLRIAGQALHQALFTRTVGEIFRSVRNAARLEGQPVTLQLRFDKEAVQLAQHPWELLHDGDQFLLLSNVDVVRYVTFPQAVTTVRVAPPLTVVLVASSPADLTTLTVASLRATLQGLNRVKVDVVEPAAYRQLVARLGPAQPAAHVFHFEGHGDLTGGQGGVYFTDSKGKGEFVAAEGLAVALSRNNIALAVVNACHSADVEGISLFNSIAPALILAGVPAVIGMQGEIGDRAAADFAQALYEDLSRCVSVTAAVAHARAFLFQGNEWYKPALYLRSTDDAGQILVGCEPPPTPPNQDIPDGDEVVMKINGRAVVVPRARLEAVEPVPLRQAMERTLGPADFDVMAWELGVKTGQLEGANLPMKMMALIDWHVQRNAYAKLVAKVIETRPHLLQELLH